MAKKLNLSYQDIEKSLKVFKEQIVASVEVGYEILRAFGKGDGDIRRYKEGKGIVAGFHGLLIKGLFCFQSATTATLTETLDRLKRDAVVLRAQPKIIAVSDGKTILAYDLRENESYENPLARMYCDFAFFYPLAGVEKFRSVDENPADVKAAEKLAKLHDEIRSYNEFSTDQLHDLNIFIARLLFCFFAEDTGIFEDNLFTGSIERYTLPDGSDLSSFLDEAFNAMDTRREDRNPDLQKIIDNFPYVNGGLFSKRIPIPKLGYKSRKIMLECGELDWKDINPDIFGSMFQAVVNPELRANQGMHYTSVPNIMKVICPLFLDELRETYNKLNAQYEEKRQMNQIGAIRSDEIKKEFKKLNDRCNELLLRMSRMKFFDPACGSGNFLIITYKALRMLEMDILRLQSKLSSGESLEFFGQSYIQINQFYGIEIEDFPHEIAMLSLWLAEHQMNCRLREDFGVDTQALPLKNIKQIVCGNACRLDWNMVCPHTKEEEVFVFGNPPYVGSRNQDNQQKTDMDIVFSEGDYDGYRKLDYIACWFKKAGSYIFKNKSKIAFVSTNSIRMGEQVSILWNVLLNTYKLEIFFAYYDFKWSNNAKNNAGVTVVIIGLGQLSNNKKRIYYEDNTIDLDYISPTISQEKDRIVEKQLTSISNLPPIRRGNMPNDKEYLRLSPSERETIIQKYPNAEKFIRPQIGADEFINDIERYCYWISDSDLTEAMSIIPIKEAVEKVRDYRINSKDKTLHIQAKKPHQMREFFECNDNSIIIPIVSSEAREYIPIGFLNKGVIVPNSAQVIYEGNLFVFGLLTSKLHNIWTKHNAGRLESRIRYSCFLCYNTFPFPKISETKRAEIEAAAKVVLKTRRNVNNLGKTLAEMYDPDTMPADLREAHRKLDDIVDSCYPGYPFANDDERLATLFKMYEKMTHN